MNEFLRVGQVGSKMEVNRGCGRGSEKQTNSIKEEV